MLNYGGRKVRPGSINLSTNAPAQGQLSAVLIQRMIENRDQAPDLISTAAGL